LQVASQFDDFPIVHEAVRECLQDDFDVPALTALMRAIEARQVRVVEVQTGSASPFANAMAFGYTAAFLYDGDAPLAERRAAALSLDPSMLAELLGSGPASDPAALLDPDVVLELDAELSHRAEDRRAGSAEALADLLRQLGPQSAEQLAGACQGDWRGWLEQLAKARRVIAARLGTTERWAVVEDAAALRDGLGVALPAGLPEAFLTPVQDPLGALVRRYVRHHGPFTARQLAGEFGLGVAVAERELDTLSRLGQATKGNLRPVEAGGNSEPDYCDPAILAKARRRTLARLRREVEPVEAHVLGAYAPAWQHLGRLEGADGVLRAIATLAGAPLPASSLETLVLPGRVKDYQPSMLDQLITAGEVTWVGQGRHGTADGTIRLFATSTDDPVLGEAMALDPACLAGRLVDLLRGGGAFTAFELATRLDLSLNELRAVLWEAVWAGWVTGDSFAPVRAYMSGGKTAHRTKRPARPRTVLGRTVFGGVSHQLGAANLDARLAGRWWLTPTPAAQGTELTAAQRLGATAAALLERHGVLTRGAVATEASFAALYPVLSSLEEAGSVRRGYFVERLGGSQFALPPCPDALRAMADKVTAHVLAAADPANPYGAALPWPDHPGSHRPGRTAGAIVVLIDGHLVWYLERGGKTALAFATGELLSRGAAELAAMVKRDRLGTLKIARLDGSDALAAKAAEHPPANALVAAGFAITPSGLTLRGGA
jgi:ATP-dependent Lhr-like helicase